MSLATTIEPPRLQIRQAAASAQFVGRFAAIFMMGAYFLRSSAFAVSIYTYDVPEEYFCYGSLILAAAYHLTSRGNRINAPVLLGILAVSMSVLLSLDPRESLIRWVGWVLIMASGGGLIVGSSVRVFRQKTIEYAIWWVHIMTCGTALAAVTGIRFPGRGVYWGIMDHSQVLGPIAALSALDALRRFMVAGRKKWLTMFVIAVLVSLLASSRAALLGLGIGVLPITKMAGSRGHFIAAVVFALALLGYFLILYDRQVESYLISRSTTVASGVMNKGLGNTRAELWGERWREFQSSPYFGTGFAMGGRESEGVADASVMGEPGSGYLAVLSSTGLVGVAGILLIVGHLVLCLRKNWNAIPREARIFIMSWGAFWAVHLNFEGYTVSVGSLLCLVMWTFLAYALDQARPQSR